MVDVLSPSLLRHQQIEEMEGTDSSFPTSAGKQLLMAITKVICMNKLSFSSCEKFVCMILRLHPREILRYWGL